MVNRQPRGRGIINERQREYLTGGSDIEPGSPDERSIRQAIRNNLCNALLDMVILEKHLEERDRRQVFDAFDISMLEDPEVDHPGPREEHEHALSDLLTFLYRGVEGREPTFEQLLRHAIPRARHPNTRPLTPEYDIELRVDQLEPSVGDLERALDRLARDDPGAMTEQEQRALFRYLSASPEVDLSDLESEVAEATAAMDEADDLDSISLLEFLSGRGG